MSTISPKCFVVCVEWSTKIQLNIFLRRSRNFPETAKDRVGPGRSLYNVTERHPDQLLSSNAQYTAILVSRSGPQMVDFGQIVSVRASVRPLFWHIFCHAELKSYPFFPLEPRPRSRAAILAVSKSCDCGANLPPGFILVMPIAQNTLF